MPYVDGLPVATSVSPDDVLPIDQGGTPGLPGTAITRQATVAQLFLALSTELQDSTTYANDAAAQAGGVAVGEFYRNGSVVQIRIT